MVSKVTVDNNEIQLSFNKKNFLTFLHSMGFLSDEAKKSTDLSWRQYKKGNFKVLKSAKDLLA
ncbi:MAG: hypothetical protein RI935_296 [Candidatus Parcubacteria bacterium]|jgi:hypothetical protein